MAQSPVAALLFSLCLYTASGAFPRAHNVTWRSINFKTILSWEPQPTEDFSFTVEFSALGGDRQRAYHCIRSSLTTCDLSSSLSDPDACYTADVLTEPPRGAESHLAEPPHSSSPRFCPYTDTIIGRPEFRVKVSEDKKKTTLFIVDPLTALFSGERQLSVRDVFSEDLQYQVTYRRNKSTGKKVQMSRSSVVDVEGLDPGQSYCFTVQVYISSRTGPQQLGLMSQTRCSDEDQPSIFRVYSVGVIACAVFLILLLVGVFVAVVVVCCKHRKNNRKSGKEGVPLQNA